jgi:LPPG:FO 2-phospho-L-lactate transferase
VLTAPTYRLLDAVGRPTTAAGVASLYAGLIDAMVVDEDDPGPPPDEVPVHLAPTLMEGAAGRARLARIVLDHAASLVEA